MALAEAAITSLGTTPVSSSTNWWTKGMFTDSNTGVIFSVVTICLIICAARVPLTTPREREAVHVRERDPRPETGMRVVRRTPLSSSDYAALDKPTVQRQRAVGDGLRSEADPEELLDIPAFLRRQAD